MINHLPASMAERALTARKMFIDNPSESQLDDEMLVWCYYRPDKLWYSIAGNYSKYSPEEKRIKEEERNREQREREKSVILLAEDMYREVFYDSKIRASVLKRDKKTCQRCGKKGTTSFHVHHILKRKEGGGDQLDNLITVCPSCHNIVDRNEYNPDWKA